MRLRVTRSPQYEEQVGREPGSESNQSFFFVSLVTSELMHNPPATRVVRVDSSVRFANVTGIGELKSKGIENV